ncbi:VapC toxin family PIN domain ribonuclease [Porphyrobacter sp. HT-58-2]|uniref:type II toxin-antitoxin system VapC family toxin n=1 Tax=Porphyrobacter sp. HT-58-2 TaxID=2023229 RepID=UPI000CDBB492|nr:type II toxin-antitoxin system VapC family toxin [Porphyrobacter sp. HT-58-2]AUX69592.1 VapC toxin family PIN domain ribonuclease [Porphyrobacter sp. HT-58-2]
MILLDTSIVAEAMKPAPDARVLNWLDSQRAESLYIASVTVGEILYGIGSLPDGKAKDQLAKALERILDAFSGRMLTFDTVAAFAYAEIAIAAKRKGKAPPVTDAYLAAIASGHGMTLASRNPVIYEGFGLLVIEPGDR